MNRNNCCSQNMTPYGSRTMNMGGGRSYTPAREPMRPTHTGRCAEPAANPSRCSEPHSGRCAEPASNPGRCSEQTHSGRCAEPASNPGRCSEPHSGRCAESASNPGRSSEYQTSTPCRDRMPSPCPGENDWRDDVPTGNRQKLFCYINEVSFAAYDALLYLDTHPNDTEALSYFHEYNRKRNYALKEYAKAYGPLNIGTMDDDASRSWEWACQPWPWEGGID